MTPSSSPRSSANPDAMVVTSLLWRHRFLILAVSLLLCLAVGVFGWMQPRAYMAEVSILPQPSSAPSGMLSSLVSMVGTPVASDQSYEQLYSRIVVSDRLLDRAIARPWNHVDHGEGVSLFKIFSVDEPTEETIKLRTRKLKIILRNQAVDFYLDKGTGYMVLKVTAPEDGQMAADLANFLVDELNTFNLEVRSNKAQEQYQFIQGRLEEVEQELRESEDALTAFVSNNRSYTSSPQLSQKFGVLNREIQASTSIWVELRKQLELAEIERNKDSRSVDVLDRAIEPVKAANPSLFLYAAAGFLLGLVLMVLFILVREQILHLQSGSAPYEKR